VGRQHWPSVDVNPMIGSRFSVSAAGAHGPVPLFAISGRDFQDRGVAIAPYTLRVTMFPRRVFYLGIEALWPGAFGVLCFSVELFGGFRALTPELEFNDSSAAAAALGGGCWLDAKQKQVCSGTPVADWAVNARLEPRRHCGSAFADLDGSRARRLRCARPGRSPCRRAHRAPLAQLRRILRATARRWRAVTESAARPLRAASSASAHRTPAG
jgi:hypothetical protein